MFVFFFFFQFFYYKKKFKTVFNKVLTKIYRYVLLFRKEKAREFLLLLMKKLLTLNCCLKVRGFCWLLRADLLLWHGDRSDMRPDLFYFFFFAVLPENPADFEDSRSVNYQFCVTIHKLLISSSTKTSLPRKFFELLFYFFIIFYFTISDFFFLLFVNSNSNYFLTSQKKLKSANCSFYLSFKIYHGVQLLVPEKKSCVTSGDFSESIEFDFVISNLPQSSRLQVY